jgi:hypothetical protein
MVKHLSTIFTGSQEDLGTIFGLPQDQLYDHFNCAYIDGILLQGRLYVTNRNVCFYSIHNRSIPFFGNAT